VTDRSGDFRHPRTPAVDKLVAMIFRMAVLAVADHDLAELRRTSVEQCVPDVRNEPGNLDCYLLEPLAAGGPVIACTVWASAAAGAYDSSGRGVAVADRLRHLLAAPPVLCTYRYAGSGSRDPGGADDGS